MERKYETGLGRAIYTFLKICVFLLSSLAAVLFFRKEVYAAGALPAPESVLENYRNNPYIRFYEGTQGLGWTTVHPGGLVVNSKGVYQYNGAQSAYRGSYGLTVTPNDVITRKELTGPLPAGHHYYAEAICDDVIPVGKWVLEHTDGKCIHGPFEAGRDYEYYGLSGLSNSKCGGLYDSGWIAYCADCGEALTGYVYAGEDCVKRIGYIFAGESDFRKQYPVGYLFICPECGDNLEVAFGVSSHMCKSFISCNRYKVHFEPNGAESGEMEEQFFYYGGETLYEGKSVISPDKLSANEYINPGYVFAGWSDSPSGQGIFVDGGARESIESYFDDLSLSGEGSNDKVITLYAVWKKTDSILNVSAGSFKGNNAKYNGVENGLFEDDKNSFFKGYMYETYVDDNKLTKPLGYRISLHTLNGVREIYSDTALCGWLFESDDSAASAVSKRAGASFLIEGRLSGSIKEAYSDGSFIYLHTSEANGGVDLATALWKSTGVTLPYDDDEGMIFNGWYSDPDLSEEHYVGKAGDIIMPSGDMELYASYKGISLIAEPDYMGKDIFGALRYDGTTNLSVDEKSQDFIYKYYYSDSLYGGWVDAVTEENEYRAGKAENYFFDGGSDYEYTAPITGIYKLDLWGGSGASYEKYSGEKGEKNECEIFLYAGDVISVHTGSSGKAIAGNDGIVCEGGEGSEIYLNGKYLMSASGGDGATFVLNVNKRFDYTGYIQTYQTVTESDYTLQVWGSRGGATTDGYDKSGYGGYSEGVVHLEAGKILYICVGGRNGYNGGGRGGNNAYHDYGGSGGGATHIASANGLLSSLSGNRQSVYIVAGGGGGSAGSGSASGSGGGNTGGNGFSYWPGGEGESHGGTQNKGGEGWYGRPGGFGYGGIGEPYENDDDNTAGIKNGGGGGGWYGGGGGNSRWQSYGCGGAGGSGYIGGVENGYMKNGECAGNGYAIISCNINVVGEDRYGAETGFAPEGVLYRNHNVFSAGETVYPENVSDGSGCCIITEPENRYYESGDCSVYSPDSSAPDRIDDAKIIYEEEKGQVRIIWNMPIDNGTDYYYRAKAFRMDDVMNNTGSGIGTAIESLTITTGTYCYYYTIDETEKRDRDYVADNGIRLDSAWTNLSGSSKDAYFTDWYANVPEEEKECSAVCFIPDGTDKYIHIVSADRAGNISDVFDMAVDGRKAYIPYPVVTEKITIDESDIVYKSADRPDTYYVRADGTEGFTLDYSAYIKGQARNTYQIEEARICISGSEYSSFIFEKTDVWEEEAYASCTGYSRSSTYPFIPSAPFKSVRDSYAGRLSFSSTFITFSEDEYYLYPRAAACLEKEIYGSASGERSVFSSIDNDRENGIRIIGDHSSPECMVSVNGGEYIRLSECNISNVVSEYVIDRREDEVNIDIYVFDEGSGVKNGFEISVENDDNGMSEEYTCNGSHYYMQLKMDRESEEPGFENMLYNGEFHIEVLSEDNVGNKLRTRSAKVVELDVSCEIKRLIDDVSGPLYDSQGRRCMKSGESGCVISRLWGYPDAVLVSFENEELEKYNTLYIVSDNYTAFHNPEIKTVYVDSPGYLLELSTDFVIPLDMKGSEVSATVRAFKNDDSVTWHANIGIIKAGSVLDELYSVLR